MDELFQKVYGALIGAAVGDAMGGPVELWTPEKIRARYGVVRTLLPYDDVSPSAHGPWAQAAGTYTDDSRMSKIFCQTMVEVGGLPTAGDVRRAFATYYHQAADGLAREFIEEYYYQALYGAEKQPFGGQPTNGAIMGIAPFGVMAPCDPARAFAAAYEALFMADGYALHAAAMAAAGIAAAMTPGATLDTALVAMLDAVARHKARVEGPLWRGGPLYHTVAAKNERLVEGGVALAKQHRDVFAVQAPLLAHVRQPFFADGAETLAIAWAMAFAANGDYEQTIIGCVNFGRDNDSSASVAGALLGALGGAEAIPATWREIVERVNEGPTFLELAEKMCGPLRGQMQAQAQLLSCQQMLLGDVGPHC